MKKYRVSAQIYELTPEAETLVYENTDQFRGYSWDVASVLRQMGNEFEDTGPNVFDDEEDE